MTLFVSLVWGLVIAGAIYTVLEWMEIVSFVRHAPRRPVSGMESMIGAKAVLEQQFSITEGGLMSSGRVRINGERWKADWSGPSDLLPEEGSVLTVVDVDSSSLQVTVR